ncbi:MAG: hypothetical protein V2A76_08750 [Planctomycetota bacterium]
MGLVCSVFMVLLAALYFMNSSDVAMFAIPTARNDDRLFIELATALVRGSWFGPYDSLTLAKSPGYAFWLAACHVLGMPLLFAQKLLYLLACTLLVRVLPACRVNRWFCLIIYAALLFIPVMTTQQMLRVYRSSIHPALIVLLISVMIRHFLVDPPARKAPFLAWGVFSGCVTAAFWLNREEGICALPLVVCLAISLLCSLRRQDGRARLKSVLFAAFPFLVGAGLVLSVAALNRAKFGVFTCCEIKSSPDASAMEALQSIKTERLPYVTVSRAACDLAGEASPAFKELRPCLEKVWAKWSATSPEDIPRPENEIAGGWFPWALRDAAQLAGHHYSAPMAEAFYTTIAAELNRAFAAGTLAKDDSPFLLGFLLSREMLRGTVKQLPEAIRKSVTFWGCDAIPFYSRGPQSGVLEIERFTGSRMEASEETAPPGYFDDREGDRTRRHAIWLGYSYFVPWISILGVAGFVIATCLLLTRRKTSSLYFLCGGLFLYLLALLLCLCMIHTSSFHTLAPLYLSTCYPLVVLCSILSICLPFLGTVPRHRT